MSELPRTLTKEQLEVGGITIRSGLNQAWQDEAQKTIDRYAPGGMEGAAVLMEPGTGLVRAMVGGKDYQKSQFNRASHALRSPGSTFKLFTYTAALKYGLRPEYVVANTKQCYAGFCVKAKGPPKTSLANAVSRSLNAAAVATARKVGYSRVIGVARDFGITGELGEYPSMVIGSNEQYVVDMTAAYAAINNRGIYVKPTPFEEIYGPDGELLWSRRVDAKPGKRAVTSEVADAMQWMLLQAVRTGTGAPAGLSGRPVAGKTGTSEGARDLWFIGSIPQLTTGIWLGYDNNRKTGSSSAQAAYAWHSLMTQIVKGMPVRQFPPKPVLTGSFIPIKPGTDKPKPETDATRDRIGGSKPGGTGCGERRRTTGDGRRSRKPKPGNRLRWRIDHRHRGTNHRRWNPAPCSSSSTPSLPPGQRPRQLPNPDPQPSPNLLNPQPGPNHSPSPGHPSLLLSPRPRYRKLALRPCRLPLPYWPRRRRPRRPPACLIGLQISRPGPSSTAAKKPSPPPPGRATTGAGRELPARLCRQEIGHQFTVFSGVHRAGGVDQPAARGQEGRHASSRRRCCSTSWWMESGEIRQRASAWRARVPSPEQGASMRMRRKPAHPFGPLLQDSGGVRLQGLDGAQPQSLGIGPYPLQSRAERSSAHTSPRSPINSAMWVLFPPGAAQTSSTLSSGSGSRRGAMRWALRSCTHQSPWA